MAIQFDGNGTMDFTTFSLQSTEDFIITFSAVTFNGTAGSLLGFSGNTDTYLRIRADGDITRKIGSGTAQTYNTSPFITVGEPFELIFSRISGNVSTQIDGNLVSAGGNSSSAFIDRIGGSGITNDEFVGIMSGSVSIEKNTDLYYDLEDDDNLPTIPETLTGRDGTLTGFTTGGWFSLGPPVENRVNLKALRLYLLSIGYTGQIDDMVYNWLVDQGYTGSLSDMWYKYLLDLGYSGSVNDKRYKWKLDL